MIALLGAFTHGMHSFDNDLTHRWKSHGRDYSLQANLITKKDGSGGSYFVRMSIDNDENVTFSKDIQDIGFEPVKQTLIDLAEKGRYIVFEFRISNYLQMDVIGVGLREDSINCVFFGRSRYGHILWSFKPSAQIAVLNDFRTPTDTDNRFEYELFNLNRTGLWFDKQPSVKFGPSLEDALKWTLNKPKPSRGSS